LSISCYNGFHSILSYLLLPKVDTPKIASNEAKDKEHSSRLAALSNFSIGDMFKDIRDGPKSVKFPEKLLKVLEQKLQDIAMGKDPACGLTITIDGDSMLIWHPKLFRSARPEDHGQILRSIHGRQFQATNEGE
jgi:hypothetical protein